MLYIIKARFLFWNIHKRQENIDLALEYGSKHCIDVIVLCEMPPFAINKSCFYSQVQHISNDCLEIGVFIKTEQNPEIKTYFREKSHFCMLRLDSLNINLVAIHLNSQMYNSGKEIRINDIQMALSDIDQIEARYQDKRTLVVGDFNCAIWDEELLLFTNFNTRLFKYQMKAEGKTIHKNTLDTYYNPMLSVYKDNPNDNAAKGTYYYAGTSLQWLCYDQILMKKPLVNLFNDDELEILSKIDSIDLVKDNKPISTISDHLPLTFQFDMED